MTKKNQKPARIIGALMTVFLIAACSVKQESPLRDFLKREPQFNVHNLLDQCEIYSGYEEKYSKSASTVDLGDEDIPATVIVRNDLQKDVKYIVIFNLNNKRLSHRLTPTLIKGVIHSGWVMNGYLKCRSSGIFSGIIFLDKIET